MPVTIRIPSPLRKFTAGQSRLQAEAGTVRAMLEALGGEHPDLRERLFSSPDTLRLEVRVFVGETDIRNLSELDTEVADGQTVALLLPVAGA